MTSDALLQHLPSYLGFSYLGHGLSLHSCSSKEQLLLLTLDEGYLLTTALPDLQRGIAPLGPPAPMQPGLECIPRYLILFVAVVNGIDSFISLSDFSLFYTEMQVISLY